MKYYFKIHEIFWTVPFNILSLWLVFLVQLLKVTLNILHRLFYLIIVIGSIATCLDWNWKQNHNNQSKKNHQHNLFIRKWDKRKSCWQTNKYNDRNPDYLQKYIRKCHIFLVYTTVVRVKNPVDFFNSFDELTISKCLRVCLIFIPRSGLNKSFSILISPDNKCIILKFFVN